VRRAPIRAAHELQRRRRWRSRYRKLRSASRLPAKPELIGDRLISPGWMGLWKEPGLRLDALCLAKRKAGSSSRWPPSMPFKVLAQAKILGGLRRESAPSRPNVEIKTARGCFEAAKVHQRHPRRARLPQPGRADEALLAHQSSLWSSTQVM